MAKSFFENELSNKCHHVQNRKAIVWQRILSDIHQGERFRSRASGEITVIKTEATSLTNTSASVIMTASAAYIKTIKKYANSQG
jgi:hypothetical protein